MYDSYLRKSLSVISGRGDRPRSVVDQYLTRGGQFFFVTYNCHSTTIYIDSESPCLVLWNRNGLYLISHQEQFFCIEWYFFSIEHSNVETPLLLKPSRACDACCLGCWLCPDTLLRKLCELSSPNPTEKLTIDKRKCAFNVQASIGLSRLLLVGIVPPSQRVYYRDHHATALSSIGVPRWYM